MPRKLRTLQATALTALVFGLVLLPSHASAQRECDRLTAWAEKHLDTLPSTYDGLANYPASYRRAIFRAVEPEVRSRFWRAHLERYLDTHPNLTSGQQEVLRSAIDLADAAFFNVDRDDPQWSELVGTRIADLERRARPLFSAEQMRQIFEQLGGPEKKVATGALGIDPIPAGIQCSCSVESDYCGSGYDCWYATCDQHGGCGTFWTYTCNGLCFHP